MTNTSYGMTNTVSGMRNTSFRMHHAESWILDHRSRESGRQAAAYGHEAGGRAVSRAGGPTSTGGPSGGRREGKRKNRANDGPVYRLVRYWLAVED